MVVNLNVTQSQPSANLKVTLLIESLKNGQFAASIFEFPNFRVEAQTREDAITQLQTTFLERLSHIEAISWNLPIEASVPTWMQFAGVFQNDQDFQEIMNEIRSQRTSDDDSEVDSSYYL
ncbi:MULTISPECIES: hypothetical protein [Nostocales]|uniref:hypothetical protein n=1 Tax=Nostocales TaxID=1161 RepID=UPI0016896352|nr:MULTISPECIES: hypothetical protein [Nostocales]MBD2303530.1 hypothetical protein [Nostoc sp. FACHB-190]MBD2486846.1 hypothetical protein [Aulosira sp. FACHB-615]